MSDEDLPDLEDAIPEDVATFEGVWVNGDGRIVSNFRCSAGQEIAQVKEGCRLIAGTHDSASTYFDEADQPQQRPFALPVTTFELIANGIDEISLTVPEGTEVLSGRRPLGIADDGLFEFDTVKPGTYEFEIRPPFPYQVQTVEVIANAA